VLLLLFFNQRVTGIYNDNLALTDQTTNRIATFMAGASLSVFSTEV
jgi:hypothetical protein